MFVTDRAQPTPALADAHSASVRRRPLVILIAAAAAMMLCCALVLTTASSALADSTYTATQTIPIPPASDFAGSAGGDGWALAVGASEVFNVFHHQATLQVACHEQSDASACWPTRTITDNDGNNFATQGQPGLYLNQSTGDLYVYATRSSDSTAGVVCIDTNAAVTSTNPFCGYTPLTAAGDGPLDPNGISGVGSPNLVGTHWYGFNYVSGSGSTGTQNKLLCFDVSTGGPCAGQPYDLNIGSGNVSFNSGGFPAPAAAAIGPQVVIPITVGGSDELACWNDSTQAPCTDAWPIALGFSYAAVNGSPYPYLDGSGNLVGFCLPTGTDQCYEQDGDSLPTPVNMPSVIAASSPWNGPAFVLGPRVYVPNGNYGGDIGDVQCFDYSTGQSCANFPKTFNNLGYLYTVNPDPQRPTCIWVNSDNGSQQIQNFDAYTGGPCGEGDVRVLGSQFIVPQQACYPDSYQSLQVLAPAPSTYSGGTVTFEDGDGNPIAGAADRPLDGTGTVSLTGLNLNTPTGLPEFLLDLNGEMGSPGAVTVQLTWTAPYDPSCVGPTTTVSAPPPTTTVPAAGSTSGPPVVVTPPKTAGTALPGHTLTCQPGTWSGNPTGYTYTWSRNGKVISGATGSTYTVKIGDEAATLTCTVTAHNATGSSPPEKSPGVIVGYLNALGCPKPTGRLAGTKVGVFGLGLSRSRARRLNSRYKITNNGFDNFCLYAGWGIRVGYPSRHLLSTLDRKVRRHYRGRIVLALTANPFYALDGVSPGAELSTVASRLHVGRSFHVGSNDWYFVAGKKARGVLKVRNGVVQEVGLASRALTANRALTRRFIRSFKNG